MAQMTVAEDEEEQWVLPRLEPASDTDSRGVSVRSGRRQRGESLLREERLVTGGLCTASCARRGRDAVLGSACS